MNQTAILYPVIALAGWTFIVLSLIPYQRFKAVLGNRVVNDDFKFGESANVPPEVSIPNRNYMNLLELPVLFYVVCLMLYFSATGEQLTLNLAWGYVTARMLHSIVHLSYNNVVHRLTVFAISNFILMALWALLFKNLISTPAT